MAALVKLAMTVPAFNARTQRAQKEGILNSRSAWAMKLDSVSGQGGSIEQNSLVSGIKKHHGA